MNKFSPKPRQWWGPIGISQVRRKLLSVERVDVAKRCGKLFKARRGVAHPDVSIPRDFASASRLSDTSDVLVFLPGPETLEECACNLGILEETRHARALAELAVQGVDIVLTRAHDEQIIPHGLPTFRLLVGFANQAGHEKEGDKDIGTMHCCAGLEDAAVSAVVALVVCIEMAGCGGTSLGDGGDGSVVIVGLAARRRQGARAHNLYDCGSPQVRAHRWDVRCWVGASGVMPYARVPRPRSTTAYPCASTALTAFAAIVRTGAVAPRQVVGIEDDKLMFDLCVDGIFLVFVCFALSWPSLPERKLGRGTSGCPRYHA